MADQLQQDAELWFDDGSVVVIAQQTAFRVHRGVLSRHSETFSGLFTLPQSPDPSAIETMDGCPVVRVPESSHDMKHLLHALYDGTRYWDSETHHSFSVLAALARLGHKYELQEVFASAMKRLKAMCLEDFSAWRTYWNDLANRPKGLPRKPPHPIEAYNLFRATGQSRLLPIAMFQCSDLPISSLLNGVARGDGTTERLPSDAVEGCLNGKLRITVEGTHLLSTLFCIESPSCITPERCRQTDRLNTHVKVPALVGRLAGHCHRFFVASMRFELDLQEKAPPAGAYCAACSAILIKRCQSFSVKQWNALPETFGLKDAVTDWPAVALDVLDEHT